MILPIIFLMLWVFFGVIAYGINLAYFQRKYPDLADYNTFKVDRNDSLWISIGGPVSLLAIISVFKKEAFKYGLMFKLRNPY